MKQYIKNQILPPIVKDFIVRKISLYKTKKLDLTLLEKNKEIKDKYKGKRCFILGNSPSIQEIDITSLKNEYVFVMSHFYNHPEYKTMAPFFHSLTRMPSNFNDIQAIELLKDFSDNINRDANVLLNLAQKELIEENNLFKENNIFYVATAAIKRCFNMSKITAYHNTNPLLALEAAIYMGFEEIFLFGIEMNAICEERYEHFSGIRLIAPTDPALNSDNTHKDDMSKIAEIASSAFKEYEIINNYANNNNIKIFNLSSISLLRMFIKKDLNDIIRLKK